MPAKRYFHPDFGKKPRINPRITGTSTPIALATLIAVSE
jgi:hypothetical protein